MRTIVCIATATSLLSGCATTGMPGLGGSRDVWTPTIDTVGVDQARYEQDFAECRSIAEANPDADGDAAARDGALRWGLGTAAVAVGATVLSGGLAAVPILAGSLAAGAGGGALMGAQTGRLQADIHHQTIITNCLEGRGYRVLG